MTVMATPLTGAPSAVELTWDTMNWQKVRAHVRQLQMRIAKAYLRRISWVADKQLYKGLSRVRRKKHARFLGERRLATVAAYPAL